MKENYQIKGFLVSVCKGWELDFLSREFIFFYVNGKIFENFLKIYKNFSYFIIPGKYFRHVDCILENSIDWAGAQILSRLLSALDQAALAGLGPTGSINWKQCDSPKHLFKNRDSHFPHSFSRCSAYLSN